MRARIITLEMRTLRLRDYVTHWHSSKACLLPKLLLFNCSTNLSSRWPRTSFKRGFRTVPSLCEGLRTLLHDASPLPSDKSQLLIAQGQLCPGNFHWPHDLQHYLCLAGSVTSLLTLMSYRQSPPLLLPGVSCGNVRCKFSHISSRLPFRPFPSQWLCLIHRYVLPWPLTLLIL